MKTQKRVIGVRNLDGSWRTWVEEASVLTKEQQQNKEILFEKLLAPAAKAGLVDIHAINGILKGI